MALPKLSEAVVASLERVGPVDVAIGLLTYNNAETLDGVLQVAADGLARHFPTLKAALVVSDAGSADATRERAEAAGLPAIVAEHQAPTGERVAVPFHGVPGRGAALRMSFGSCRRAVRARKLASRCFHSHSSASSNDRSGLSSRN